MMTDIKLNQLARIVAMLLATFAVSLSTSAEARQAPAETITADSDANSAYLRLVEDKRKSIALEIVTREFARPDGTGPKVGLVGVAHIAERAFYRQVQKLLDEYDVVLFESVKPAGTGGAGGETDQERIDSTRAAMKFVAGLVESHRASNEKYPKDLDALAEFARKQDPRVAHWLNIAMIDAWGRNIVYTIEAEGAAYSLKSLGADGAQGGEGADADVTIDTANVPDPLKLAKQDNLQEQLADALKLEFQLAALDYSLPNWRCSDMAVDEVSRRLAARGIDFGPLGGTLAGTSFSAKLVGLLLSAMRMLDNMLDGAVTDMFKVVMIEILSDEKLFEHGIEQFGKGFGEVIIVERNQVALRDLRKIIDEEPEVKSIAILYGAGHMPDMARRLKDEFGMEPVGDTWITAIKVDFTESVIEPAQFESMRRSIRMMLRQQFGPRK